jgi:ppGpp synthetase/RelA/SpoT-type nucleotidyltranferase
MSELRRGPSEPDHQPTDPQPADSSRDSSRESSRPAPTEDATARREPRLSIPEPNQPASSETATQPDDRPSDRPAEPAPPPTRRTADASPNQADPFAAYSPELRAHMRHDDTLAHLQYLSKPEPDTAATSRPTDQPDLPSKNRPADNVPETKESPVPSDGGRPNTADTVREIRNALSDRHPDVSGVVERLVTDKEHPLDVVASLNNSDRRPKALATIRELADERLLADRGLQDFAAEHPGRGPLFEPVRREVNHQEDGQSRKSVYVAHCKSVDAARTVGANPSPDDRLLVQDYGRRLVDDVLPQVRREVRQLAGEAQGRGSIRAKDADGLLDKVERMSAGSEDRPTRPDYQVGDVIDAVGARITIGDTDRLERLLSTIEDRFGSGDGGRILELENMYAGPKPHNPSYRVVPLIIAVEVNRTPYTFELQLCTWRASIASDLEHNTIYKPYIRPTPAEQDKVRRMQAEAAALDQDETRSRWHD